MLKTAGHGNAVRAFCTRVLAALLGCLITASFMYTVGKGASSTGSVRDRLDLQPQVSTALIIIPAEIPRLFALPMKKRQTARAARHGEKGTSGLLSTEQARVLPVAGRDEAQASMPDAIPGQALAELTIDSGTIGKAYRDSRTEIRRMADAVKKPLEAKFKSKFDFFQDAAVEAAVPACISKNGDALKHDIPHLGPVILADELALPFFVHAVLKGKCK
ncbi:hypothetical protein [Undibacterium terreum]|nr:hypothetical protein [Undibacterium terreum]